MRRGSSSAGLEARKHTSIGIPLLPPHERLEIPLDLLPYSLIKHDAPDLALLARLAKRAPLESLAGVDDRLALLVLLRKRARLRQELREEGAVAREGGEREGLPRDSGGEGQL